VEGEAGDREDVGADVGEGPDEPLHRPGEDVADPLGDHGVGTGPLIMQPLGLKETLETLPTQPGVYLFKDREGTVLYVGKARVLRDRVRQYFQAARPTDPWRGALLGEIADVDMVLTDSEMEALALENNFIKRHQPRFNVLLRDDKNHPYLKLTLDEEYPRIYVVRRGAEDGNDYGGPSIPAKLGGRPAAAGQRLL